MTKTAKNLRFTCNRCRAKGLKITAIVFRLSERHNGLDPFCKSCADKEARGQ
jgi:hypothetical protein